MQYGHPYNTGAVAVVGCGIGGFVVETTGGPVVVDVVDVGDVVDGVLVVVVEAEDVVLGLTVVEVVDPGINVDVVDPGEDVVEVVGKFVCVVDVVGSIGESVDDVDGSSVGEFVDDVVESIGESVDDVDGSSVGELVDEVVG